MKPMNAYAVPGINERTNVIYIDKEYYSYSLLVLVCELMNVDIAKVLSKSRKREYVSIRQIVAYYLRKKDFTQQYIADFFGLKNHSTIISSIKKVNNMLDTKDRYFTQAISFINIYI